MVNSYALCYNLLAHIDLLELLGIRNMLLVVNYTHMHIFKNIYSRLSLSSQFTSCMLPTNKWDQIRHHCTLLNLLLINISICIIQQTNIFIVRAAPCLFIMHKDVIHFWASMHFLMLPEAL